MSEIRQALRRRLDQVPMTIDLVMTTEGYAGNLQSSVNSIYHAIFSEGQVAYEQRAS